MTRIAPAWLDAPATAAVVEALAPARPLFVGGCVRDALMGRPTHDIDIAVATPPAETEALAAAAGLKVALTGVGHGVVTVIAEGRPFECATLRRDVETDGRRAVIAFTTRVEEDAARRDFTLNALYADPRGEVIDPTGEGLADLHARRIRFIGDEETRIREDYLRILRFFRFHARFGVADFDPGGLAACRALAPGLARISAERITAELLKLLAAPDPWPALAAMGGILDRIVPGADLSPGLTDAEAALGLPPEPLRRLAALGGDCGGLRLSRAQKKTLAAIGAARGLPPAEAAWRHGADAARAAAALAAAEGARPPDNWRAGIAAAEAAEFPVSAADLKSAGVPPGPELGAALKRLEDRWIASCFTLSKQQLLSTEAAIPDPSGKDD